MIKLNLPHTADTTTHDFVTGVVGQPITMLGAVSGLTSGTIQKKNATVVMDGITLTGMGIGNYEVQHGDSGAGVNIKSTINYVGVQSGASFHADGSWAGQSTFTPCENFR